MNQYNVCDVSSMNISKDTVINHLSVSNLVAQYFKLQIGKIFSIKSALCGGSHPVNYKSCDFYSNLFKRPNNLNNEINIQYITYHNVNVEKKTETLHKTMEAIQRMF